MALTTEQKELRRKILIRNARIDGAEAYFDEMLAGGEFCMSQLTIWAAIFNNEEVNVLRTQAAEILERAAALEQQLGVQNG